MAQDPLQVDAIQIEPGSGDTLTVARNADGEFVFVDESLSSGATLTQLAGIRSVPQILTVGQSGAGASYNTIQEAIDAVPATASESDPYVILVLPGVYAENLTVETNGISIVGMGAASSIISPATGDAITVQASVTTTPKSFEIKGLRVEATEMGKACLLVSGGAGSEVAESKCRIIDCELVASGAGGFSLKADSVNNILAMGGDWGGGNALSSVRVTNCASLALKGQANLPAVQLDYDTAGAVPSVVTTSYVVSGIGSMGDLQSTLTTNGSLLLAHCGSVGDVVFNGDQSVDIVGCSVGDIAINDSVTATIESTKHGALSGDGSVAASNLSGEVNLDNQAGLDVVFDVAQTDINYTICVEIAPTSTVASVHTKTVNGFRISLDQPRTGRLRWHLLRS